LRGTKLVLVDYLKSDAFQRDHHQPALRESASARLLEKGLALFRGTPRSRQRFPFPLDWGRGVSFWGEFDEKAF